MGPQKSKIRAIIWDMYGTLIEPGHRLLTTNAATALRELKDTGYLLGLATSIGASRGEEILRELEIFEYFDACSYGSEVKYGKPDPEIYLLTAEKLGVEPEECAVVEDSEDCFKGVKSAGMKLIARRAGHNSKQNFALADTVVEDLGDVPGVVKGLA